MRSFIPRASPLCFLMFGLLTLLHQFKSHHAFVRPIVSSTKFISFTTSSVSNIHKASSLKEAISASLTSSDAISSSDSVGSNENNITIRRMTLKDVATVFHIGESVFTSSKFPQLYRTWSAYEVTDSMATDPELCFVAEETIKSPPRRGRKPKVPREDKTQVVGFALGSIAEKRKREQSCGYLGWVAVMEEYQRQGVGTMLAAELEKEFLAEDIQVVVADTPGMNVASRNFLEKMGFGNPVSHVYMRLNIEKAKEAKEDGKAAKHPRKALPDQKTVKVRQMEIDDLAAVHELGEEVFTADKYPNLFQTWSEAEVIEMFGSDAETCYVAIVDNELYGFVLGNSIEKKHSSWKYGYLIWLAVSPKAQRLGVGKKLFDEFQEAMEEQGCRLLLCDTQADNLPARGFFERQGFSNIEDHVYYTKALGKGKDSAASGLPQARLTRLKGKKIQTKVGKNNE